MRGRRHRVSNIAVPATSRHSASAAASINTHRKCFPRQPLWANQSATPLVQCSASVRHPSESPAPGRLLCRWLVPTLATHHEWHPFIGWQKQNKLLYIFGELIGFYCCSEKVDLHLAESCVFQHKVSMLRKRIFISIYLILQIKGGMDFSSTIVWLIYCKSL